MTQHHPLVDGHRTRYNVSVLSDLLDGVFAVDGKRHDEGAEVRHSTETSNQSSVASAI